MSTGMLFRWLINRQRPTSVAGGCCLLLPLYALLAMLGKRPRLDTRSRRLV